MIDFAKKENAPWDVFVVHFPTPKRIANLQLVLFLANYR